MTARNQRDLMPLHEVCDQGPRYALGGQLGVGGGGVVHVGERRFVLGERGTLERACAIKLMYPSRALDAAAVGAFTDEAMLGYELSVHPNLVATRDLGLSVDGRPYLVMEHAGHTLEKLASSLGGRFAIMRAIADSVLGALDCLHGHGLAHGDVHWGNIYVCPSGTVKLGDLGRARPFANAAPTLQPRADLRRLGLMLHTLLVGWPQRGAHGSLLPLAADTPPELRTLVQRLLSCGPEHTGPENTPAMRPIGQDIGQQATRAPSGSLSVGARLADELSADELRTILRASHTEIARPDTIAAWVALYEAERPDHEQDDDRYYGKNRGRGDDGVNGASIGNDSVNGGGNVNSDNSVNGGDRGAHEYRPPSTPRGAPVHDMAPEPAPETGSGKRVSSRRERPRQGSRLGRLAKSAGFLIAGCALGVVFAPLLQLSGEPDVAPAAPMVESRPAPHASDRAMDSSPRSASRARVPSTHASSTWLGEPGRDGPRALAFDDNPATRWDSSVGQLPVDAADTTYNDQDAPRAFATQFMIGTDRFSFSGRAQDNSAGVRLTVDRGQWLQNGHVLMRVFLDNSSRVAYRLAHARLLRADGTVAATVRCEYFTPNTEDADADDDAALMGIVPAGEMAQGAFLVEHAAQLSGQRVTLVLSEPEHARAIELVLEWP